MITSVAKTVQSFRGFLECFDEEIIVTLKVYLDESIDAKGKNATGMIVPAVCGYIATSDDWKRFVPHWAAVLEKNHAKTFHFREFSTPSEYKKKSSQYYNWTDKKRDRFLHEMAIEAGLFAIPVGGVTDAIYDKGKGLDPYAESITAFFLALSDIARKAWPNYKDRILVIWDKGASPEWSVPMTKIHAEFYDAPNSNIGGLLHGDDRTILPLQAADLFTYIARQNAEKFFRDSSVQQVRLLDFVLNKNMLGTTTRHCGENDWRNLIAALRVYEKQHRRKHPGQKFYVTKQLVESYDYDQRKFV
jgi:hypothetical protein